MKRDKRAWAGVLAAATLWLASVCAGSDDLTAAVNAVRQSGLVRRLVRSVVLRRLGLRPSSPPRP